MITSDSHSCAAQGNPARVKEYVSTAGTAPCDRIHSPVVICQGVSGSRSTTGSQRTAAKTAAPAKIANAASREIDRRTVDDPEGKKPASDSDMWILHKTAAKCSRTTCRHATYEQITRRRIKIITFSFFARG